MVDERQVIIERLWDGVHTGKPEEARRRRQSTDGQRQACRRCTRALKSANIEEGVRLADWHVDAQSVTSRRDLAQPHLYTEGLKLHEDRSPTGAHRSPQASIYRTSGLDTVVLTGQVADIMQSGLHAGGAVLDERIESMSGLVLASDRYELSRD